MSDFKGVIFDTIDTVLLCIPFCTAPIVTPEEGKFVLGKLPTLTQKFLLN